MMKDLSILYYSACTVDERFAQKIRDNLLEVTKGEIPIISITLKPVPFGDANICCTELGAPSTYNVYRQILLGTNVAETEYVACAEDDCLYTLEHFTHRPDCFAYNRNCWRVYRDFYLHKHRRDVTAPGMWNCIAPRALMIETLEMRFQKYPVKGSEVGWGEPGRHELTLRLPPVKAVSFATAEPNVTFSYRGSLGGIRKVGPKDVTRAELPYWGKASDLWARMWNGR